MNMSVDKQRRGRRSESSHALLRKAMRNPGVAEMMKVYGHLEEVIVGAAPYVAAMEQRPVLFTSTSSQV